MFGCATQQAARVGTSPEIAAATARAADHALVPRSAIASALEARLRLEPLPLATEAWADLRAFYAGRGFAPVFTTDEGYDVRATLLDEASHAAEDDGLPASQLPLSLTAFTTADERAEAELRVATSYLLLAQDLIRGRVSAQEGRWHGTQRGLDRIGLLRSAAEDPSLASLAFLAPAHPGYRALRGEYVRLRNLAGRGGWPIVPTGKALHAGERDPRVALLRRRLLLGGELAEDTSSEPTLFDPELDEALRAFQRHHGLAPDGVLGGKTLAALRVSTSATVAKLAVNLERWRWLPDDLGATHLWVNVPAYELHGFRNGEDTLQMRVVVGKTDWQTPLFEGTLTHFELNPSWHVTRKIANQELVPLLREKPNALKRIGMKLLDQRGKQVDPAQVDWDAVGETMPYQLVQGPGAGNPLGAVKFVLPNHYGIYLHDSPSRWAFDAQDRRLSHGCVRVERALDLIDFLVEADAAHAQQALESWLPWSDTRKVMVNQPVPVRLVYFTTWVDQTGALNVRDDIYGRDAELRSLGTRVARARKQALTGARTTQLASAAGERTARSATGSSEGR